MRPENCPIFRRYPPAIALSLALSEMPRAAFALSIGAANSDEASSGFQVSSLWILALLITIALCAFSCLAYRKWLYRRIENEACTGEIVAKAISELEGPLTALLGSLDWLRQGGNSNDANKRLLGLAHRNAVELKDVVERVRDLELARSGMITPEVCVGELRNTLRTSIDSIRFMAENRDIVLEQNCDLPKGHFLFDEGSLGKILHSLFSRATAFAGYGGSISFSARMENASTAKRGARESRMLRMALICQRKEGTSNRAVANKWEASVDLALARALLAMCGGSMSIRLPHPRKDRSEAKLEIDAYLPVKRAAAATSRGKTSAKTSTKAAEAVKDKPVIAVIEDSKDLLSCIRESLENEYTIFGADSNDDGLQLILRKSPDLVILEAKMQRCCGFELCRRIRDDIRASHLPVIMLAPRRSFEEKVKGMRSGADMYMAKPINFAFLRSCIHNMILNRQRMRQRFAGATSLYEDSDSAEKTFIEKASGIVDSNLSHPDFEVEAFAKAIHLSRSTLNRKLKALTGHSPAAFIREARLQKAALLLRESDLSVAEISFEVGFADHSHFTARFKERFKYTPSHYRVAIHQGAKEKETRFIQAS